MKEGSESDMECVCVCVYVRVYVRVYYLADSLCHFVKCFSPAAIFCRLSSSKVCHATVDALWSHLTNIDYRDSGSILISLNVTLTLRLGKCSWL